MKIILLLFLILSVSFGKEYYCVQLASSKRLESLKRVMKYVSTFPYVRIEKIGNYYVLRAGFSTRIENAKRLLKTARKIFKDAFVRKCIYDRNRIIYPKNLVIRKRYTYDVGMRLARLYLRKKDFKNAEKIYRELLEFYPDNREIKLMLARVLFWQGKYDEAIELYKELEKFDPELINERRKVEISKILKEAERLEKEGKIEEAIKLLEKIYREEKGDYEVGLKLGLLYIKVGLTEKAMKIFSQLKKKYPHDKDINHFYKIAKKKFYRNMNYVRIGTRYFAYTNRDFEDKELFFEVKKKNILKGTLIAGYRAVNRFNNHNDQVYGEFYRSITKGYWGYISGDFSPQADFLPVYSLGGGIFKTFKKGELGMGFRYMRFENSQPFLLIPAAIIYISDNSTYRISLFLNTKRDTYTLVNRFSYKGERFNSFFSFSFGTSSERREYREDFYRYSTFSLAFGSEYRVNRKWSIGASFRWENRQGLYKRYGGEIYGKYWW